VSISRTGRGSDGAASGIGLGMVEKLLAKGPWPFSWGTISQGHLTKESERLNPAYPGKVHTMLADVTSSTRWKPSSTPPRRTTGTSDFVFNKPGWDDVPTEQVTFDTWRFVLDLNLMGVIYGTYAAIPIMREQARDIVNTGSIGDSCPSPTSALRGDQACGHHMTECLQYELEVEGLRFSVFPTRQLITAISEPSNRRRTPSPLKSRDYIFQELEKGSLLIVLPEQAREMYRMYRKTARSSTSSRAAWPACARENYRTREPITDRHCVPLVSRP